MSRIPSRLLQDQQGATLVEFAIALPVLILMMYGIFTFGLVFQANAGVQHALGEAARYATIFPTPSDADIQDRIASSDFGTHNGTFKTPVIDNSQITNGYKTISVEYTQPTNFLFFPGPTVTLTQSKRVYISN